MVLSSSDMFSKSVCLLLLLFFLVNISVISVLCFVGPDFGPNCLQKLSADDTSK